MSTALPYIIAVASIAALLGAIATVRLLGEQHGWSAEVQRKAVHVMVGLFALALPAIFSEPMPVVILVLLAIVAMFALRASGGRFASIGGAIHSVERPSYGDIWLAVAIGFLFLRSEGSYLLYGLPLAILTLSDTAAALTGSTYGRRRFVTEGGVKSWEGIVAFTLVGWIVAMSMLLLFSDAPRGNVIVLGLVIALFGAMVEAVSWRGLDNLFVPLAIFFYLRGFLHADLLSICVSAVIFLALTALAQAAAANLKLAPQTARAFAVALIIIIGVGDPFGAVMPFLAMTTYLLTRRLLPSGREHPDLDFLATLCGGAAVWLFVGEMVGPTAILCYNLSMAGFALGYGVMGLRAAGKLILSLPLGLLVWTLAAGLPYTELSPLEPPSQFAVVCAASLAFVTIIGITAFRFFRRWRAPKTLLLASIIPLSYYAYWAQAL